MKLNEILLQFVNEREKHEQKVGRYNSSSLYEIITNKLKPKDFFKPKTYDLQACQNIIEGEIMENALKELFDFSKADYEYQIKKVLVLNDFEIVAKPDFLFKDKILECKSPVSMPDKVKDYHFPQAEAYFRIFQKPVWIIYIQHHFNYRIFRYQENETYWRYILEKLKVFHEELLKICQTKK